MPGTLGSILGVLFYFLLIKSNFFYIYLVTIFCLISIFICDYAEKKIFKIKDPKEIVIDEIAGILVSYSVLSEFSKNLYINIICGFLLFRFFDITKPFPIKQVQKTKGGLGIMLDDIIAGIYTALLLKLIVAFQVF